MKKIVLCIVLIVVLAAGCATLSKQDRALVREFNKISLTADEIDFIKDLGLDPNHLTLKEKVKVMEEMDKVFILIMY
ncbi:MAG: hypothetical protein A3H67_01335 [Candidatus Buchananbacteria bacterium RIFCSPLOWO2_02_FULL_46_11b]|uniref:Lipoprotein n=1 Tax=Candidatus Buchananbacteria bacterium RIFCSPLOWO2_02_FULL_46_11b TaxID=1797548 RepID=A0A1G1Z3M9_9BACT|nr:MAG: hypothetical protein A3H67_01335 [Candidatus Buchananbacteria bacterium RIFCSPLOWO2_02_FULL_46_11b]